MDDFFKKKLLDHSPAPDGWNTPSDDLWNKAKPHFPKQNKTTKYAWLFWSCIGLLLLSIAGWNMLDNSTATKITTANIAQTINSQNEINNVNTVDSSSKINDESQNNLDKTTSNDAVRDLSLASDNEVKKNTDFNKVHSDKESKSAVSKIKQKSNSATSTSNATIKLASAKLPIQNETSNNTYQNQTTATNIERSKHLVRSNNSKLQITSIALLPNLEIAKFDPPETKIQSTVPDLSPPTPLIPIIVAAARPRFEFGLAASTHPADIPYATFHEIEGLESINSEATYNGMNYQASILAHKNLSISSGMYFSNQNIDLELSIIDTFYNEAEEFRAKSKDLGPEIQSDVIEFNPGVVVEDGELLRYDGQANLRINSMRIPLMINFHLRKKRFEALLTAGASFGMNQIKILEGSLEIRRFNELIAVDDNPPSASLYFPQASVFYGGSLKYHIAPNLNAGVSVFADRRAILPGKYLRVEYGLFVRL